MNKRIRELVEQAMELVDPYALEGEFGPRQLNEVKFAELIVRECARVAGQEQIYNERHEIPVNIEQSVLEHFGVE